MPSPDQPTTQPALVSPIAAASSTQATISLASNKMHRHVGSGITLEEATARSSDVVVARFLNLGDFLFGPPCADWRVGAHIKIVGFIYSQDSQNAPHLTRIKRVGSRIMDFIDGKETDVWSVDFLYTACPPEDAESLPRLCEEYMMFVERLSEHQLDVVKIVEYSPLTAARVRGWKRVPEDEAASD